jgi:oxygen-independent coproporphyrinogen-3 oxidase
MAAEPLVVEIRVPFCPRRCGYCDADVLPRANTTQMEAYAAALLAEIDAVADDLANHEVQAIRFTGGSPNLLGGRVLAELLKAVYGRLHVAAGCEVSVGCSPFGVSIDLVERLTRRDARLRFELELDTSDALQHLGLERCFALGAPLDAARVVANSRNADFDLPVLYGLEGQGLPSLRASISTAVQAGATHLTLAPLRLTAGTSVAAAYERFCAEKPTSPRHVFPDEAKRLELYRAGVAHIEELGFERYTQRHFARPGHQARWTNLACAGTDLAGFGAGASSWYDGVRCTNTADAARYTEARGDFEKLIETSGVVDEVATARRALRGGLFAVAGVDEQAFAARWGLEANAAAPELAELETAGLLERADGRLRLTEHGGFCWDDVQAALA